MPVFYARKNLNLNRSLPKILRLPYWKPELVDLKRFRPGRRFARELGLPFALFALLFFAAVGVIQNEKGDHQEPERIELGISGCCAGERVFDGFHFFLLFFFKARPSGLSCPTHSRSGEGCTPRGAATVRGGAHARLPLKTTVMQKRELKGPGPGPIEGEEMELIRSRCTAPARLNVMSQLSG